MLDTKTMLFDMLHLTVLGRLSCCSVVNFLDVRLYFFKEAPHFERSY